MVAPVTASSPRRKCVDIRSYEEYSEHADDPLVCLHLLDGDFPAIAGKAYIDSILWMARVGRIEGDVRIDSVRGSTMIEEVSGSASIRLVHDSARIGYIHGNAAIESVRDFAHLGAVTGAARIGELTDWSSACRVGGSALVQRVSGFARLGEVGDQAVIGALGPEAVIARLAGNATVNGPPEHVEVQQHARIPDDDSLPALPAGQYVRQIHPSWIRPLAPVLHEIAAIEALLRSEKEAGRSYQPADELVLRAFAEPFDDVRVVVLGQDPYPAPGHAVGLSFSVAAETRPLPGSLRNIFLEYAADLGFPPPSTGDLSPLAQRGVFMLNRVLTVGDEKPASHRGMGWESITTQALTALAARPVPLVALLWGADARDAVSLLRDTPVVASAHPGTMSAASGFFGSRPFTRVNRLLAAMGADPIDWRLS